MLCVGKLYRREFLRNHQIYFADLSYAEDKLFNMQCYICDAKYAFLEDIGYIYRKNDISVSWQYRPDSVENWFKLVYELKSWIEKKDKDPKEYTSLIGYLLIFAAFFDGKWNICSIKNLCGLSERFLRNMEAIRWGERLLQSWQTEEKNCRSRKNCGRL